MHVLILGGYGFIGLEITRRLSAAGHAVTAVGRSPSVGARTLPGVRWLLHDIALLDNPALWLDYLRDIDIVVNASGALQDSPRDSLKSVQDTAIIALIAACEQTSVRRFVQISAPGANVESSTEFMRSKARADQRLKTSALEWTILKPGLVIGASAYGGSALIRALASFPLVQPLVLADRKIQTVALTEVADMVRMAIERRLPAQSEFDLVEPEPHTLREIVTRFRRWLGMPPPRHTVSVPNWVANAVSRIADGLAYLGWRSPLRTTSLQVLRGNVIGDPRPLHAALGRHLSSLDQTLEDMPSNVQERWFARLYLALPIMIGVLSAFWLLTGLVALLDVERATRVLSESALSPSVTQIAVIGGSLCDIALGAAIVFRPWAKAACFGMVAVTLFYLAAGTVLTPELWMDPLGPLLKTLPAMVLALVTAGLLENR